MNVSPSPHFAVVQLDDAFNWRRTDLPEPLRTPERFATCHSGQTIRGMPFAFGPAEDLNVVLLDCDPVSVELNRAQATYVVFVHAVEDVATDYQDGLADRAVDGHALGGLVSEYELQYEDGSTASAPIRRRFAIQQARCRSRVSVPLACVPAAEDHVFPSAYEAHLLGRFTIEPRELAADPEAPMLYGLVEQARTMSAQDRALRDGLLWIYALRNPHPDRRLRRISCIPRADRSALYAVTTTGVVDHPLRAGVRQKLRLPLPDGVEFNAVGEVEEIGIDLGTVISARPALDYDRERWAGEEAVVEPSLADREAIVEYAAHPQARLHIGGAVYDLGKSSGRLPTVAPAHRPVRLRFVDSGSRAGVAVRLHIHGEAGEYLPPRGHQRKVNPVLGHDRQGDFVNVENQYAYVDGACVVDLPLGTVYVEVTRGHEIAPMRSSVEIGPETGELVFELDKVLHWREQGWVTADTHVHLLSPHTALLEGKAEGINVVNLLATQWGETFSNVADFDGATTLGGEDLGGGGEFLVRVGSENRMQVLGHISLLGYSGELIQPLCTGGPTESAIGDPVEVTMAEWAERCIDQGGLVVMPHAPFLQFESAADIVLGLVHALELMTFNPLHPDQQHLNPYGVADWYRYLNLGYHLPLVGGSDKMSAAMLLGGVRTYAQMGGREFTYENWMNAIRDGNTFATVGPLASIRVEGAEPGGKLELPPNGGTIQVEWEVESVRMPIERVEIVVGGLVDDETNVGGELAARGRARVAVKRSTWVALRVRGSYRGDADDIAAHTSAVQVLVESSELFSETDSMTVLDQIQGALAYVDTIAPRAEERRFRQLRATLEMAYNRLHQRMHAAGVYHRHPHIDPGQPHEH